MLASPIGPECNAAAGCGSSGLVCNKDDVPGTEDDLPCWNTCGPNKSGFRQCRCVDGLWFCAGCAYEPSGSYGCYAIPADVALCPVDVTDPTGQDLPASGGACAQPSCAPCGSSVAASYRDATGSPRIGYCVCVHREDGQGFYGCASVTEWPPP